MKQEKLDLNTINQNNVTAAVAAMQGQIPPGAVMLDKNLLPSRGKFYPETIYVKKLNTLAIKNLSTITQDNVNNVINNTIQQCILGIDPHKILIGDKIWLIFYLRAHTFNDYPFTLRGECPNCKNIAPYQYVLKNLDVTYLDKDIPEEFKLPNGDVIKVTFPTLSTEAAMNKIKTNDQIIMEINPELLELSSYISNINGRNNSLLQGYEYLINMPADCFTVFANELSEYVFSAKPYAIFNCKNCETEMKLQMAFVPSFFMPNMKK